jgi:mono/diheme cytochrome c family protein
MASRIAGLLLAVAVLIAAVAAQSGQGSSTSSSAPQTQTKTEIKYVPARFSDPSSGQGMYVAYCASCHGKDAKGEGPAAPALKAIPTNLTLLAAKNGGVFPETYVAQVIKGDTVTPAHGSKEMPVWGPVFLRMDQHQEGMLQLRVHNLTTYLQSLQLK